MTTLLLAALRLTQPKRQRLHSEARDRRRREAAELIKTGGWK